MPTSRAEQILETLRMLLAAGCAARVERNAVLPERIPAAGLIVIYDGDPGEPEQVLGGFSNAYYQHQIEITVYAENGDAAGRDQIFDALLMQIGQVLEAHPTLDGLVAGLSYARPDATIEPAMGAPAIKTGTIILVAEYDTDTPLS